MINFRRKYVSSIVLGLGFFTVFYGWGQLGNNSIKISNSKSKKVAYDLSGSWCLFVDDHFVENKESVKRVYHPFRKHSNNPLIVADKPWEGNNVYVYGTVLPNEFLNGYRLWYHAWSGEYSNLYATSIDGINWEKPNLGIVEFNGSTENNIFFKRTKEDHLPQVIYTPWDPDSTKHYKLLNYDYGRTKPDHVISGFWGAYSEDGIHWIDAENNPVLKDPGDVGNFVWDAHKEMYVGYPKIFSTVRGFNRRCVGYSETKNFENWPSTELILVPDKADDHWVTKSYQRTEFYGLSAFPYESGYIGFLWIFHITDGKNDGPIFCELVSSHDGTSWVRQEVQGNKRIPVLPTGRGQDWDRGMVFTTNHPLVEHDIIKLWYGGSTATHGGDQNEKSGIGLATLRKDGFASIDALSKTGIVTTKPLINVDGKIRVNANVKNGILKVEILNRDNKVVSGFSREDCLPIRTDGVDIEVLWRHNRKIPKNEVLKIRFIFKNASLYSFHAGQNTNIALIP